MSEHKDSPDAVRGAYAQAGVDIAAAERATALMKRAVQATYTPEVLAGLGAFGGLYDAAALRDMVAPILVASTDGVGTKTLVAAQLKRWESIGYDLVHHCVNDILVQGARPLFFLDYVATGRLDPAQIATVVTGVANACRDVGAALLGGETAEMPAVYHEGAVDLVGTIIGVVDRSALLDGSTIAVGDRILGLPASGLHTNGYSLVRRLVSDLDWTNYLLPATEAGPPLPLGDVLLRRHRCYLEPIMVLRRAGVEIHGLAHITGGGIPGNLPRILPPGTAAQIRRGTWSELPIFGVLQKKGAIDDAAMFQTFNMGLGMLVVLPAAEAALARQLLDDATVVGEIVAGNGGVLIEDAP
jgi:phosphoribosylformylglycinamidine cyclo-ligase